MAYQFRRDFNSPGVQAQVLGFGVITVVVGFMGLFGAFGTGLLTRIIGAVVLILGIVLSGLAVSRLRR